jgi:hypothetical protein
MTQLRQGNLTATAQAMLRAFEHTTDHEDWDLSRHNIVQRQYTYHGRQALSMWESA